MTKAGDERAFDALLAQHKDELELYCRLMLGDACAARHAMAETVLAAWRDHENAEAATTARMWLYRIATDICFDAIGEPPIDGKEFHIDR
jgi:RNA polymerase sigma-70 factor (ECF subfamily)